MDLSNSMGLAGIKEDTLRNSRLTRVYMGRDTDVTYFCKTLQFLFHCA